MRWSRRGLGQTLGPEKNPIESHWELATLGLLATSGSAKAGARGVTIPHYGTGGLLAARTLTRRGRERDGPQVKRAFGYLIC